MDLGGMLLQIGTLYRAMGGEEGVTALALGMLVTALAGCLMVAGLIAYHLLRLLGAVP